MIRARLREALPLAPPGSKAYTSLHTQLMQIDDLNLKGEDFLPQQAEAPAGAAPGEGAVQQPATGTDRLTFNPRADEQVPV